MSIPLGPRLTSQLRALESERQRRASAAGKRAPFRADPLLKDFPEALTALRDPTRHRALRVGRGGAKTTTGQWALLEAATAHPACAVVYMSTTINRARKTVWEELRAWNRDLKLGGVPRELQSPELKFPEIGSTLYVSGAETKKHIDRWRGVKRLVLVFLDELQDWDDDLLTYAINSVFLPRLNDRYQGVSLNGRLLVAGTGRSPKGYWHRICTDPALGFKVHRWDADANPHVEPLAKQVADACKVRGVTEDDPYIRREYRAEFTRDGVLQVFPPPKTVARGELPTEKVNYAIGADVGSVDRTAVVVWAWTTARDRLWVEDAQTKRTPASSDQVAFIREFIAKYEGRGLLGTAVDPGGGGKGVIEDLRKIRGLWEITEAEKQGKVAAARELAGDFRTARAVVAEDLRELLDELPAPEWDPDLPGQKLKESLHWPDIDDAALYGYRLAARLWYHEPAAPALTHEQEALRRLMEAQQAEEAAMRETFG